MNASAAALLFLADGRFPGGGYAHSGGLEPVVASRHVTDLKSLGLFLEGRAVTVGLVAAAFSATACDAFREHQTARLAALGPELDARTPSQAQRATSRQLGRQLLHVLRAIKPNPRLDELNDTSPHPIALGVAAAVFDLTCYDAALLALHDSVAGPAAAAVKLLGVDPFGTHACLAQLGPLLGELAESAAGLSRGNLDGLPASGAPMLDLHAERHAATQMRLFAS